MSKKTYLISILLLIFIVEQISLKADIANQLVITSESFADDLLAGEKPVVRIHNDKESEKYLNDLVQKKINNAQKKGNYLNLSHIIMDSEEYISILLHFTYMDNIEEKEPVLKAVDTLVINKKTNRIVDLEDIMGSRALALTNKAVVAHMQNNPRLFPDFEKYYKKITEAPAFYLSQGGNIVFLFSQGAIAPTDAGIIEIEVDISTLAKYI